MGASSYQSTGSVWKAHVRGGLLLALSVALIGATPYEDTQGRFRLALPDGWGLAPQFGDTFGMSFEKPLGRDRVATFLVHVDPVSADDVGGFADAVEGLHDASRQYRRLGEEKARVAGQQAVVRRYAAVGASGGRVRVQAWYVRAGKRFFHLRTWAPSGMLRSVIGEVEGMVASFHPGAAAARGRRPGGGASARQAEVAPDELIGVWWNAEGVRFALGGDGGFVLGGAEGRYRIEGRELILKPSSGGTLRFSYALVRGGLELKSPALDKAARYTRRRAAASTSERGTEAAAAPIGAWKTSTPKGPMILTIAADGAFSMGTMRGTWVVEGDRLVLAAAEGERASYRFKQRGSTLTLSEGDLEKPLTLRKVAGK